MKSSYPKTEKLKSKKQIETLFSEGKSVRSFPLSVVFIETNFNESVKVKCGVSVSKKKFKTAVERNKIKRLIREAYRLNKNEYFNNITTQYALMILYIGSDKPTFNELNEAMKALLKKFVDKVS